VLPLGLFALTFFPSDTERWIFLLPPLVPLLAPGLDRRPRAALALVLGVGLANVAAYHLPVALDRGELQRAAAAERLLTAGDLVVSPGHGWDELIGLGMPRPPERFPLAYHAGARRHLGRALAELRGRVGGALRAGRRVYVARLVDSRDRRGFKELAWLGLAPGGFEGLFVRWAPGPTVVPGLWRLFP
jgi:hypothetical protein